MQADAKRLIASLRASIPTDLLGDGAIALVVTVVAAISWLTAVGGAAMLESEDLAAFLFVVSATLPLVIRRLWPLATLLVVEIGLQGHATLGYAPIQAMLFASLVAVYSAAMYADGRRRYLSLLIAVAGVALLFGRTGSEPFSGATLTAYLQWSAAWLLGIIHRLARERTARV
jgi:hypothetical protein